LCGAYSQTCVRETFDRVRSEEPLPPLLLLDGLINHAQTAFDNAKTWCKYHFPASPEATQVPWRDDLYVWACERQHRAVYFHAMMGPQVVSPHAELEWCVPLTHLDHVLAEVDATVVKLAETSAFYRQPIECHLRFSPPDACQGHGAYGSTHDGWFAWVNLNARQHLDQAATAWAPIEAILMRHGARVHWSKCWSGSEALLSHVRRHQAPFLAHLRQLSATHDPHGLFASSPFACALGLAR
jgi:hypothetical protein